MKTFLLFASVIFFGSTGLIQAQRAFLEQSLIDALQEAEDEEIIPVLLLLENGVDVAAMKAGFIADNVPVNKRAQRVMSALKSRAEESQRAVLSVIHGSEMPFSNLQTFWISNSIALEATPSLIALLANHPEVERMTLNSSQYGLIAPEKGQTSAAKSEGGIEPGLATVGAPEMWAMGYTGKGRVAMTFDTGVWPEHPAFTKRFLPNRMPLASTWLGFDSPVPTDKSSSHGTHVSGTMLGLDTATADTIGMAPRAYFIATDPIVSNIADVKPLSELMLGFQWALNPDGDETTSDDIPDVINNSWGRPNDIVDMDWGACSEFVIPVFDAVLAAGIANVFSAGNDGPNDMTIGIPNNINTGLVNSFAVGAVSGSGPGPNWPIANFSSRGPSICGGEGSLLIKPEVSAPGVNVRSSVDNDGYDLFSGTSMAAPHVSGAILLLKEAFPYLSGEDLMLALYYTAVDQGVPGEDNVYGMGIIHVKHAFDYLAETHEPVAPATTFPDLELVSINSPSIYISCDPEISTITPHITVRNNGSTNITGVSIKYSVNGLEIGWFIDPLITLGAGEEYQIELPPFESEGAGSKELHTWIEPVENEADIWNNHMVYRWIQLPQHMLIEETFTENFETGIDPEIWTILNPDGSNTWDTSYVIQTDGEMGTAAWMKFVSYNPIASQQDDLIGPWMMSGEVNNAEGAVLSFDYYYQKRTSNAFTQDSMAIFVHPRCEYGEPFEIFRAGGEDLWTVDISQPNAFPQDSSQWRHMNLFIPVPVMVGDEAFFVRFVGINRRSNNLLIDNVNIEWVWMVETKNPETVKLNLFPNPTRENFTLTWNGNNSLANVYLHDTQGRNVKQYNAVNSGDALNLNTIGKGLYIVEVRLSDGYTIFEKLLIQ